MLPNSDLTSSSGESGNIEAMPASRATSPEISRTQSTPESIPDVPQDPMTNDDGQIACNGGSRRLRSSGSQIVRPRVRRAGVNGDQVGPEGDPLIDARGRKPAPQHSHGNQHPDGGFAHSTRRRLARSTEVARSTPTTTGRSHHQLNP